jgi:hypothetical protein
MAAAKKPTININPAKAGDLRAKTHTPAGKTIPVGKLKTLASQTTSAGKQTVTAKQAQFALNARSFNHPKGK